MPPYPIDRRLRLCARVSTQHLFVVVRRRSSVVSGVGGGATSGGARRARAVRARLAVRRACACCCPVAAADMAADAAVRGARALRLSWCQACRCCSVRALRLRARAPWVHGAAPQRVVEPSSTLTETGQIPGRLARQKHVRRLLTAAVEAPHTHARK